MKADSRAKAKERGEKRYFTGKPCPSGHISDRHVSSGACVVCAHERTVGWRERNAEALRVEARDRYRETRAASGFSVTPREELRARAAIRRKRPRPALQAAQRGDETYMPLAPCRYGHTAPRFTSNRRCTLCHKEAIAFTLYFRERAATQREHLMDNYVKSLICGAVAGLRASDIPQPLIEAKRVHLKVNRELKERLK